VVGVRPLSNIQKTALIFYLAYTGLLCFISFWSPAKQAVSGKLNPDQIELKKDFNDLSNLQQSFEALWKEALNRQGWEAEQYLISSKSKLEECMLGQGGIKWINASSNILLPKNTTEEDLIELISDWEDINRSLKLDSAKIQWGYQKKQLWVKLANELSLKAPGGSKTIPIHELTLTATPGAALNHRWPGVIPRLPPEIRPPGKVEIPKAVPASKKPRVALIIDDVGSVRKAADAMLNVPARLTWSVLPFTPHAQEYIEAAKERGFEIMLHQPMEPLDRSNNPGPGLIKGEWTEEVIIAQLEANLDQVPGAAGLNNHMGSAGVADERLMEIVMGFIKDKNIYFVDSMTSQNSLGEAVARRYQVRFNKRDVFIDNLEDIESKKRALRQLIKVALNKGEAIGIGHVRNGTAEAIIEMLPEFEKAGIEIVPVSELLDR
jgi:polysaccharide deacetylase 2 family uncharacterized protein YibQ